MRRFNKMRKPKSIDRVGSFNKQKNMKKLIALAVIALSVMSVSAQKGSIYLGLSNIGDGPSEVGTGFWSDDKNTDFGIAPEIGYFLSDDMAVGAVLGFGSYTPDGGDATTSFRISPYLRYFILKEGNFSLYGQGQIDYIGVSDYSNTFGINIMPGIAYNLSSKFSINATFGKLGFNSTSYDEDGRDSTSAFGLRLDASSLNFGLSYTF